MIKIGVLGVGHIGKIHVRLLKEILYYEGVGFFDPDDVNAEKAASEFGIKRFATAEELMDAVDAIDIVAPTIFHYDYAVKALKRSKHIFIEKPMTSSLKEAKNLRSLAAEADVKVQIGHVER